MSDGISVYDKVKLIRLGSGVVSDEAYAASMEHGQCMFVWPGKSKDEVMGTSVYMNDDFFVFGENGETKVFYRNCHGGIIPFRREGSASEYRSCGVQGKTLDAAVEAEKRDFMCYRSIIDSGATEQPEKRLLQGFMGSAFGVGSAKKEKTIAIKYRPPESGKDAAF